MLALISAVMAGCGVNSNKSDGSKAQNGVQEEQQDEDIRAEEVGAEEEAGVEEKTDDQENLDNGELMADEESDEMEMPKEEQNPDQDIMPEDMDSTEVVVNTEYIPIAYRENALIVQRSEDIELYGLLDNQGNIVIEPEYDKLSFKFMNGKDYIKATLAGETGILDLEGRECIEMGKYDDIASAGDAGWRLIVKTDGKIWGMSMSELMEESNIL
jgi:AAA ATPase containing von Willebrand factor type A (vWA) domain